MAPVQPLFVSTYPPEECGILDKASGTIRMYYGGADTCMALATAQLSEVLSYLRKCPAPPTRKRAGMTLFE